jgi:hypothetical protein
MTHIDFSKLQSDLDAAGDRMAADPNPQPRKHVVFLIEDDGTGIETEDLMREALRAIFGDDAPQQVEEPGTTVEDGDPSWILTLPAAAARELEKEGEIELYSGPNQQGFALWADLDLQERYSGQL